MLLGVLLLFVWTCGAQDASANASPSDATTTLPSASQDSTSTTISIATSSANAIPSDQIGSTASMPARTSPQRLATSTAPTSPPTSPPTTQAIIQPRLQYRLRSAIFPDRCLTIQARSIADPILTACSPAVLFGNQSFTSIPQAPKFDGDIVDPAAIQLVNGVVWAWTFPVDPAVPNQVRLTNVQVYGTNIPLNLSTCLSVPKMNEAPTYPLYWFPCIVNSSNIWLLEPIIVAKYTQPPVTAPPTPGMTAEQLVGNAPYGTLPIGTPTPAPATCKPVLMSHIGRHGDRHATDMSQFMSAITLMVSAQRVNSLTPFGTELLKRSQQVVYNVRNLQLAALTPQGQQEVYNYSRRMVQNFPSLFLNLDANSTIVADATDLDRTLSSRKQALYALRDSGVNISSWVSTFAPSVCTTEYNILRAFEGCREFVIYNNDGVNFVPSSELKEKTMANATNYALDFYNSVFVEGFEVAKNVADNGRVGDRIKFADDLWRYVCGTGAAWSLSDVATGVCSLIPRDVGDLLAYSDDVVNYRTYGRYTPTATTYMQSCLLAQDIHSDFTDYMAGKTNKKAHLRYAHRETLLPYLSNMNYRTRDPYFLQDVDWKNRDYNTIFARMAANIQKVLYKCGSDTAPTYYIKMLLNENETVIPGCDSVYCPWERYNKLAADWVCDSNQFKRLCNGLIVFCGSAKEIALSQQPSPNDIPAGPPPVQFGSSPFDSNGPFAAGIVRAGSKAAGPNTAVGSTAAGNAAGVSAGKAAPRVIVPHVAGDS